MCFMLCKRIIKINNRTPNATTRAIYIQFKIQSNSKMRKTFTI